MARRGHYHPTIDIDPVRPTYRITGSNKWHDSGGDIKLVQVFARQADNARFFYLAGAETDGAEPISRPEPTRPQS